MSRSQNKNVYINWQIQRHWGLAPIITQLLQLRIVLRVDHDSTESDCDYTLVGLVSLLLR